VNRPEPLPSELAEALARAGDRLGIFGRDLLWYGDVTSTNDLAAAMAERGAPEGTVVSANAQHAGRGRYGRTWSSPAGAGLYVSTVLRPQPRIASLITIAAGVAIAEAIQAATGLVTRVKWPNDIYAGDRKLAGVLAEATGGAAGLQHVVLGCGINVMPAAYPPDVAARATSIEGELGRAADRGLLLAELLSSLAFRYEQLRSGQSGSVTNAWRARAAHSFGRAVRWDAAGNMLEGIAENIDEGGALVVRTRSGIEHVISGELTWI
jgi:BirA family biotin operon repressor/biotin-[acetyl-CoA-carboxylase] ligase